MNYIGVPLIEGEWSSGTYATETSRKPPKKYVAQRKTTRLNNCKVYNSVPLIVVCYTDLL